MTVIRPVQIDGKSRYVVPITERMFVDIQHVIDRYRIVEQRRALSRIGIPVNIDRGREWWMR